MSDLKKVNFPLLEPLNEKVHLSYFSENNWDQYRKVKDALLKAIVFSRSSGQMADKYFGVYVRPTGGFEFQGWESKFTTLSHAHMWHRRKNASGNNVLPVLVWLGYIPDIKNKWFHTPKTFYMEAVHPERYGPFFKKMKEVVAAKENHAIDTAVDDHIEKVRKRKQQQLEDAQKRLKKAEEAERIRVQKEKEKAAAKMAKLREMVKAKKIKEAEAQKRAEEFKRQIAEIEKLAKERIDSAKKSVDDATAALADLSTSVAKGAVNKAKMAKDAIAKGTSVGVDAVSAAASAISRLFKR